MIYLNARNDIFTIIIIVRITRSFSEKVSAGVETGSSDWYFFLKQLQIFEERGYGKCA